MPCMGKGWGCLLAWMRLLGVDLGGDTKKAVRISADLFLCLESNDQCLTVSFATLARPVPVTHTK